MAISLTLFRVTGLHGRHDISIPLVDNKLVLVGENGTGKSTMVNLMYYFLTRQWNRLARYQFTSIEAIISGESISVTPAAIAAFNEYAHHFTVAARHFPPHVRHSLREFLFRASPDLRPDQILDNPDLFRRFAHEADLPQAVARDILIRALRDTRGPEVAAFEQTVDHKLSSLISEQLLYLPTYRRIEQDLQSIFPGTEIEAEIRKFRDRVSSRIGTAYTELVAFGMEDVERAITDRMTQVKENVRKELNNLTGTYLRDVLQGAHSSVDLGKVRALDQSTLSSIFARIDEATLPTADKERLRTKVADMAIKVDVDPDDKVIAHFLSKLIELYRDQQASETDVHNFVRVSNAYLTGKEVVYDNLKYELRIHPTGQPQETLDAPQPLSLRSLSSGEKQIVSLFSHIYLTRRKFFVIIDEPELSLSVPWQRSFLPDILSTGQCTGLVAVTHSPFIWDNALEPYVRPITEYTTPHHAVVH